ncbi:uncharacterized protein [Macrobrachium rosenbergii]|uniref:uncharacterized protein n=1 Tax=Macrobrachium rosenbergii TaxID=79674 RepID=UPI0034D4598A
MDSSGRHKEISLSREMLLRQLLPEVRGQIKEPYTLPVEDLIRTTQQLTDSTRAATQASMPAHPINCLQPEEPNAEEINTVTRRWPPYHHNKERLGLCYYHRKFSKDGRNCEAPCLFAIQKTGEAAATSQANMAAEAPRSPAPVGFYVSNTVSGRMMLIDTGAVRSMFPPSREDCKHLTDPVASLMAANGSPILSYGTKLLSVSILVDVCRKLLLDTESCQSLPLAPGPSVLTVCSVAPHQYASLLKEFPEVFRPKPRQVPGAPAKHGIYHHIKTRGPPTHAKFRRLPPQRLQEAKNAFAEMECMGICRKAPQPMGLFPSHGAGSGRHLETLRRLQAAQPHYRTRSLPPPKHIPTKNTCGTSGRSCSACSGLIVRFDTCTFGVERVDFLGHEISPGGVRPLASKVEAVVRFPTPTSIKGVREFLGMVNCGVVLEQVVNGAPQPIAFFSRKLSLTKSCYSTFDRELFVVYQAVRHFKFLLEGTPFTIWTDHQPLDHAFTKLGDAWSSRQQRHLAAIAEFTCTIKCLPGRKNSVADALSRVEINAVQLGIDYKDLALQQATDPEIPAIRKDATDWARQCIQCQTSKVGRHTESGVGNFPQPGRRFGHIHVDVVGPLPPSGGARRLLTVVDCSTRWPEATPMEEVTASACTKALLSSWIAANGLVERFHRSLNASLIARCTADNWKYQLPWVLLGLRTAPRANSDLSAAKKVYRESLIVLDELITQDRDNLTTQRLRNRDRKFAPCQRTYTDRMSPHASRSVLRHPRLHQERRRLPALNQAL